MHGIAALQNLVASFNKKFPKSQITFYEDNGYKYLSLNGYGTLYLRSLPSTCSTIYLGSISDWNSHFFSENPDVATEFWKQFLNWATQPEAYSKGAGYTEVWCTLPTRYAERIKEMKQLNFKEFGPAFTNKRTGNQLQHFVYTGD